MFQYVTKEESKPLTSFCEEIIAHVQRELSEYFSFDIRLIGSGEKRLITKDGTNGSFDLDYNLIIQKDKKGFLSYPEKIKDMFLAAFNSYSKSFGFNRAQNSSSVITANLNYDHQLLFSFDVAILFEGNNGSYYRLVFDKNRNQYIWNEIPHTRDYQKKYKQIKQNGHFPLFRTRYLELKNLHLRRQDGVGSFSIFLETLNEFL